MKLLRFGNPGSERPGVLDNDGRLRDLSQYISDLRGDALLPESLARLRQLDLYSLPLVEGNPRIGACVGGIGKFICIGLNYADHAAETGADIPQEPVVFSKWTSAVVGPNDNVIIPRGSQKTDWEVELGVVIGKGGRYIDERDAMQHVAGYCVINDHVNVPEMAISHMQHTIMPIVIAIVYIVDIIAFLFMLFSSFLFNSMRFSLTFSS